MNFDDLILPAKDGYALALRVYKCDAPKAVIQMVHGMEEHQLRYEGFANFLVENGYTVVTSDLRGHGKNAPKLSHIADKNGDKLFLEDQKTIREYISDEFPDVPVIIYGHSMGSIIVRILLQTESRKYVKAICSGFPNYNGAVGLGIFLSNCAKAFKGPDHYSSLLTALSLGAYTKSIKDRKTNIDWISYNEENIKAYDKDPLCGEEFTIASYNALFKMVKNLHNFKNCKNISENLSVLMIYGKDDPCVGGDKGVNDSIKSLNNYGFKKIEVKGFENMRHEIHNEVEYKKVYQAIANFLNKK